MSLDAAALAEAADVFLESGDEAKIVEERRVKEIREGADFAGHLLGELASFFEAARGGTVRGVEGLPDLGEAEVDGENGLREAIVKLAADAAALFILEREELSGELADGALGV